MIRVIWIRRLLDRLDDILMNRLAEAWRGKTLWLFFLDLFILNFFLSFLLGLAIRIGLARLGWGIVTVSACLETLLAARSFLGALVEL